MSMHPPLYLPSPRLSTEETRCTTVNNVNGLHCYCLIWLLFGIVSKKGSDVLSVGGSRSAASMLSKHEYIADTYYPINIHVQI